MQILDPISMAVENDAIKLRLTSIANSLAIRSGAFPFLIMLVTIILCLLPTLYWVDIQFSMASVKEPFNIERIASWELSPAHLMDELFYAVSGGIEHALMEWSAVTLALLCVIVAFSHYNISRDATAPVIGLALFMSGAMDMFHTLAATRLIDAVAENSNLIPFTWAISRGANATLLLIGLIILLANKKKYLNIKMSHLVMGAIILLLAGYAVTHWMALSENLPTTQFPDNLFTRPFDVVPMVIFCLCMPLAWRLYEINNSYLTATLFISLLADTFCEAYMAFGSTALFDHYFNSAHIIKLFGYALPFIGYLLDYRKIFIEKKIQENELIQNNIKMDKAIDKLTQSNEQLERFAFICSHDLQEPVRMVLSFSQLLDKRLNKELDDKNREYLSYITNGATQTRDMINDILEFCRLEQNPDSKEMVPLADICRQVSGTLKMVREEKHAHFHWPEKLPEIPAVRSQLFQILLNLVNNGLKFNKSDLPTVNICVIEDTDYWRILVKDNGIGIDERYHGKLFKIFQRLNTKSEFPGTGVGLAVCKKAAEHNGANITIESKAGEGSCFILHWPKQLNM